MNIKHLWSVEAHNKSKREFYYIDIQSRIIITFSHDLRIKIFDANDENKKYEDEFT